MGRRIAELAARQYGIVSFAQLCTLGLSRSAIGRRAAAGLLHPLHRGVYAVGIPATLLRARYLGAVMALGSGAVLSHRSAADIWELRPNGSGRIEVTIARHRAGPHQVHVHRTRVLAPQDLTVRDGIPVTSVARTLLDLGAVLRPPDLAVVIDRAERLGLFDSGAVVDVLDRANGRRGARALRQAIAAYRPSTQKSELERRLRRLLEDDPHIPGPFFNALVEGEAGTHEVDAYWVAERLAVQVDGFEFHRTRRDRERDSASDADLELAGNRVMRFTWDDVTVHGERTLRRLRLTGNWGARQSA